MVKTGTDSAGGKGWGGRQRQRRTRLLRLLLDWCGFRADELPVAVVRWRRVPEPCQSTTHYPGDEFRHVGFSSYGMQARLGLRSNPQQHGATRSAPVNDLGR